MAKKSELMVKIFLLEEFGNFLLGDLFLAISVKSVAKNSAFY